MKSLTLFVLIYATFAKKTTRNSPTEIPPPAFPNNDCRILFNELNIYSPNGDQYIELAKYCLTQPSTQRPISMKNYKLLFISHDGKLLGSCSLEGEISHTVGRYWFYVIGNSNIQNANYNINKCELSQSLTGVGTHLPMFPSGAIHPYAIVLTFSAYLHGMDDFVLMPDEGQPGKFLPTVISDRLETKIMKYTQDMYVVATSSPFQYCTYFQTFYTGFNDKLLHLLRDWQGNTHAADHSLNRCGNPDLAHVLTLPFQPFLWVYSDKTPGAKNKCNEGYQFVVELQQTPRKRYRVDTTYMHPRFTCYSQFEDPAVDIHFVAYPQVYQQGIQNAEQEARQGNRSELEVPDIHTVELGPVATPPPLQNFDVLSSNDMEIDEELDPEYVFDDLNDGEVNLQDLHGENNMDNLLSDIDDDVSDTEHKTDGRRLPRSLFSPHPIPENEFKNKLAANAPYFQENCNSFSEAKREELRQIQGTPFDLKDVLDSQVCSWFDYLPHLGKFRCKMCFDLLNQKILTDSRGSPDVKYIMWKGVGKLTGANRKTHNRQLMKSHTKSPLHLAAVDYYKLYDEGLRDNDLLLKFKRKDGPWRSFTKATEQLILAGYQSIRMNIAFYNFDKLTDLLKFYGTSIGHVHSTDDGIKKIAMVISDKLHKDFVRHLLTNQRPLSMTLDSSTDIAGYPVVCILFQTYSPNDEVKVYFYRMLEAKNGEKGVEIFDLFKNAIIEDNLEAYIKEHLFGLSTDGAPSVCRVFRNKLNQYVNNEIVATHCCCHRIELVNKRVYEEYEYLRSIDSVVNTLFRFFGNKAAKRKKVLRDMYEMTPQTNQKAKIKKWELKRIIKIRFINSKLRALSAILEHWIDIGAALEEISGSKEFKLEQQQAADDLLLKLQDGTFIATLAFLTDVDLELSAISLQLQSRGLTLIPKKDMRDTLVNRITELKYSNGPTLTKLLQNAEFDIPEDEGMQYNTVTLEDFETAEIKVYGASLNLPNKVYDEFRLFKNKQAYLDSLLLQIENYFPPDTTDLFYIFSQNNFPTTIAEFRTYGENEIVEMNQKLKWNTKWNINDEELRTGWKRLALSLFQHPSFDKFMDKKPEEFWGYYLTNDENIAWTPELKRIISNVITAPCTSVEPERMFSLYSATKTKRRFSLNPETVEAIVRIKFAGPQKLENFDAQSFAMAFLDRFAKADDRSRRTTWAKKKPLLDVPSDVEDSDSTNDEL